MRLPPLLIAVVVVAAGCGGGDRTTETRAVAPFERLEVADSVDVQVVPGNGREVRVYGGEDVLDRVETESSAGVNWVARNTSMTDNRACPPPIKAKMEPPTMTN